MKIILLTNNAIAIVDNEDWLFFVGFTWHCSGGGYANADIDGSRLFMHKMIAEKMGLDCSNDIDHINGNKLDNRRHNLRAATRSQNMFNANVHRDSKSGIKGVRRNKESGKWQARLSVKGKEEHLGCFDTEEAAIFAHKIAAKKYRGEYAKPGETNGDN